MSAPFPTNIVTIEGPDLSGKTTLYRGIHKKTGFRWNIQDRSFLSMLCYARQFKRSEKSHRVGLQRELFNLNNRIIVVLPPLETLQERWAHRGDDFQNQKSLINLWQIFSEESRRIQNFSNVLIIKEPLSQTKMIEKCIDFIESFEQQNVISVGSCVRDSIVASHNKSGTINLHLRLNKNEDYSSIENHSREGKYYQQISNDVVKIISQEIAGENIYNRPQQADSRRFYYSSSSCISSIHFIVSDEYLKVLSILRSTDVDRNASIDLKFLCHLSTHIAQKYKWPIDNIDLNVRFNCAHVRNDLPAWDKNEEKE